jgi:hypothetical protein
MLRYTHNQCHFSFLNQLVLFLYGSVTAMAFAYCKYDDYQFYKHHFGLGQ